MSYINYILIRHLGMSLHNKSVTHSMTFANFFIKIQTEAPLWTEIMRKLHCISPEGVPRVSINKSISATKYRCRLSSDFKRFALFHLISVDKYTCHSRLSFITSGFFVANQVTTVSIYRPSGYFSLI